MRTYLGFIAAVAFTFGNIGLSQAETDEQKIAEPLPQQAMNNSQEAGKLAAVMDAENQAAGRVPFDEESDCD